MEESSKLLGHQIMPVEFKAGDLLFVENDSSYHFFIIQEGQVEVFKTGAGGEKIPLAVVGDGTSIGELAMIDRMPRSATARALTEVRAVRISETAYERLLSELPDWAVAVMKALVERLRHTNEIVRKGFADPAKSPNQVQAEVQSVEFDGESSKVLKEALLKADDDELPDLA